MTRDRSPPEQISMFAEFEEAAFEAKTSIMPASMEDAIPYFRDIFTRYNAAVMSGDGEACERIEQEADDLAVKLNGGTRFGIKADDDSPCCVLERATAAPEGTVPLWGQQGSFVLEIAGCAIRIEFGGLYALCLPAFAARAVDKTKPFISDTGYRSFLGYGGGFARGVGVDAYVRARIESQIARELKASWSQSIRATMNGAAASR
jgi:hypothetical protein